MSHVIPENQQSTPQQLVCSEKNQIFAHLLRVFRIPPGCELALILAPEQAPGCNDLALRHWLDFQLTEIASNPIDENLLVFLEFRLLETLEEAYPEIGMEIDVPSSFARRTNLRLPYWQELGLPKSRKSTRSGLASQP